MVDEIKKEGQNEIEDLLKEFPGVPPPSKPLTPPPGKEEFKSYIRTMDEDLEAAKKGMKPQPIPSPLKPAPGPLLPEIKKEEIKKPPALKPFEVKIGPPEKAKPLELPKIKPPLPVPPKIKGPIISEPKKPVSGRKFLIIILVVLIGAFGIWYFAIREPEEIAQTPTPTPTPFPLPPKISEIIPDLPAVLQVPSSGDPYLTFKNLVNALTLDFDQKIPLNLVNENEEKYSLSDLTDRFQIFAPSGFTENLDPDEWLFLVFGQGEKFDAKGVITPSSSPSPKTAFIAKIDDLISLRSSLNVWETTITNDLQKLFNLDPKKASSEIFLDNIYKGADIRYRNFPFADNSIDYAIVNLPKFNASYFILTNSRESIYSIIDLLQNL